MRSEWETVRLSDVCDLVAGFAFKSKDFGSFEDKVIKITHIVPPTVAMDSLVGVNLKKYDKGKLGRYVAGVGDYVLAMTGATVGKLGRIEHGHAYINQRVLLFKNYTNVDKDFLYYVLSQRIFEQYVLNYIDSESAQANISAGTIGKFTFQMPPLGVQKKIGRLLRIIDEKCVLNKKINDNLQQQAFVLFDSFFRNISDGLCTIGDYLTPKRGRNLLSKDAIPGTVPVVAGGLEPATYHNTPNTTAPVLTISASGANAGFVNLWHKPVWSSDSSFIDSSMTKDVYFWFVMLKKRQREIFDAQTGSAQPHIYPQHIAAMPVCALDKSAISLFSSQVAPLFALIGANKDENERLSAIRDTLLPRLISGEIDVSDVKL